MPTLASAFTGCTPEEFLQQFPQFRKAGDDLISGALADAAKQFSAAVCGDFYVQIVKYQAADLLASGRYGQILPTPLPKNQRNIYKDIVEDLVKKIPRRGIVL